MAKREINIDTSYPYEHITDFAQEHGYDLQEHGNDLIGEAFLILKHCCKDITLSFFMDGYTGNGKPWYRCIYSDLH